MTVLLTANRPTTGAVPPAADDQVTPLNSPHLSEQQTKKRGGMRDLTIAGRVKVLSAVSILLMIILVSISYFNVTLTNSASRNIQSIQNGILVPFDDANLHILNAEIIAERMVSADPSILPGLLESKRITDAQVNEAIAKANENPLAAEAPGWAEFQETWTAWVTMRDTQVFDGSS